MKILNACKVGMALTAAAFLGITTSQSADAITFSLTDIGTLGGNSSYASAINEYGQVVGSSTTADGQGRAFLWEKSSGMTNLGTIPSNYNYCYSYGYDYCNSYTSSYATAINDYGQVIGISSIADGRRAFLWDKNSGMINLGTLEGFDSNGYIIKFSVATEMNNYGQVVGYSLIAGGRMRPFFWDKSSGISDLKDLVWAPGWTLNSVVGINNAGQMAGSGYYNGQQRAFVLTPKSVPEPSSALAFLALGAVGAGSLAFRQRQKQDASSRN